MRKLLVLVGFIFLFAATSTTLSSCSPKIGCELNEGLGPKTDRKGNLNTKRGKSQLFGKKKRRRMGL